MAFPKHPVGRILRKRKSRGSAASDAACLSLLRAVRA